MTTPFDLAAGWLQEHAVLPLLYALGMMQWEDISFGWVLFAALWRGPGGGHLRGLRAAGALAPGGALAGCARGRRSISSTP